MKWRVWIDWNRDGDFDDAGEKAFEKSGTGAVSGSINVPSSASAGLTRMRVAVQKDSYLSACSSFSDGEVEDYYVNIKGSGIAPLATDNGSGVLVYPNPAQSVFQLDLTSVADKATEVTILDQTGRRVFYRQLDYAPAGTMEMNVQDLPSGVYFIKVQTEGIQQIEHLLIVKR